MAKDQPIKPIKLGNKIRCKASGLTGIAVSRLEYINGCVQYCVKPKVGKDGKDVEGIYIDRELLEVVGKGLYVEKKRTGGMIRDLPGNGMSRGK